MILTGKAKEDFRRWVYKEYDYQDLEVIYPNYLVDTLIIEWLDSMGIYIGLTRFNLGYGYFEWRVRYTEHFGTSLSRKEATKQAIIKANEIYNASNTKKD